MPYFRDPSGGLRALDDERFAYLLPAGSVQITDAEYAAAQAKTPAQLKQEELAALAAAYKADTFQLQLNFLTATVNDGTTEAAKKTIILEDIAAVKAQYILDIAAINAKYA